MDIPLPDELELLESDFHLYEDYLEPEMYEIEEDEEKREKESSDSPILQSNSPDFSSAALNSVTESSSANGLKRLRSDDADVLVDSVLDDVEPSGGKRSRTDKPVVENEEDWLRYLPPTENNSMVEEETSLAVEEKTVFRVVSEIDGDFISITAPDSDERVYAKLSRFGDKEGSKKLDLKERHGGSNIYFLVVLSVLVTFGVEMVNLFIILPIYLNLLSRYYARKYQCFTGKSGKGGFDQGMQSYRFCAHSRYQK